MTWNKQENSSNGQDPWSGRRKPKSEGPPDLDESFRMLKDKLNALFGGKGGKQPRKQVSGKGGAFGVGLIILIIIAIWALSGIFIVQPPERAVVLRFGKYSDTRGPGMHWIPRFIDSKYIVNVEKIYPYSYEALMLTKDENIVSVSVAVQYRADNARDFLFNVVNPPGSLRQATASALRQVVGLNTLDSILTVGREKVRRETKKQLDLILSLYKAGLVVTDVALQPAKAPDEVKEAFDDAIKAQEDEQRFINQAQAYTMKVEPIAKGQAKRMLAEGQAFKQQVVLGARGDIAPYLAILPEYKKAPQVTRERLYLDALESVFKNNSKVFLDVKNTNNLVYLPLDKILQQKHILPAGSLSTDSKAQSGAQSSGQSSRTTGRPSRYDIYANRTGRSN